MEIYTFAMISSIALYTFSATFTPGPNNIMLLSSGVSFGFKRTIPHMLGIIFGYPVMILLIGIGLGFVFEKYPMILEIIKIVGFIYLVYLAYKISTNVSIDNNSNKSSKPFSFMEAALFQWFNPKGWIMGLTAISIFVTSSEFMMEQIFIMAMIFVIISVFSASTWTLGGVILYKILKQEKHISVFNKFMALLLVFSVIPFLFE